MRDRRTLCRWPGPSRLPASGRRAPVPAGLVTLCASWLSGAAVREEAPCAPGQGRGHGHEGTRAPASRPALWEPWPAWTGGQGLWPSLPPRPCARHPEGTPRPRAPCAAPQQDRGPTGRLRPRAPAAPGGQGAPRGAQGGLGHGRLAGGGHPRAHALPRRPAWAGLRGGAARGALGVSLLPLRAATQPPCCARAWHPARLAHVRPWSASARRGGRRGRSRGPPRAPRRPDARQRPRPGVPRAGRGLMSRGRARWSAWRSGGAPSWRGTQRRGGRRPAAPRAAASWGACWGRWRSGGTPGRRLRRPAWPSCRLSRAPEGAPGQAALPRRQGASGARKGRSGGRVRGGRPTRGPGSSPPGSCTTLVARAIPRLVGCLAGLLLGSGGPLAPWAGQHAPRRWVRPFH